MYVHVSHMLDRKLLERLMSLSPNRRLCSRPHSHESVIFSNFFGFISFQVMASLVNLV